MDMSQGRKGGSFGWDYGKFCRVGWGPFKKLEDSQGPRRFVQHVFCDTSCREFVKFFGILLEEHFWGVLWPFSGFVRCGRGVHSVSESAFATVEEAVVDLLSNPIF